MYNFLLKNKKNILVFLILISVISFLDTIRKGFLNGCDFQWQPAVLFWEGINHYQKFISNGKSDFLCQGGEYAHLFNVILYPYTLVKWEIARGLWVFTNICFSLAIPIIICKNFNLSKYKTIILLLIFLTCYPTRMTINYGQQSLFVLFFLILPFVYKSNLSFLLSGLSSIKYSTGYIIFFDYLVKKQFKNFILASIPYLLGWFIYFSYTNSDPIINFFEPLDWSLNYKQYTRDSDIYSLLQMYFIDTNQVYLKYSSIIFVFILNLFFLIKINKLSDNFLKMSLILICPLIFFPHSNYDYVLLFPLACYSLLNFENLINKVNFFFVIYFFYFSRIIKHLLNVDWLYQPTLLTFIIVLLFFNINLNIQNSSKGKTYE